VSDFIILFRPFGRLFYRLDASLARLARASEKSTKPLTAAVERTTDESKQSRPARLAVVTLFNTDRGPRPSLVPVRMADEPWRERQMKR
jgi:hypothetical protein